MIKKMTQRFQRFTYYHFPEFVNIVLTFLIVVGMLLWQSSIKGWNNERTQINETWRSIVTAPEPELCALCQNGEMMKCHAPVLVDLATGEVRELDIYTPHARLAGEIASKEKQQSGVCHLVPFAGSAGISDADNHTCWMPLPPNDAPMDASLFCYKCRAIIAAAASEGYVLLDLYDVNNVVAYPVTAGDNYTIRDYEVSVTESKERKRGSLDIEVQGLLYNSD